MVTRPSNSPRLLAAGLALLLGLGASQLAGTTGEAADGKPVAVLELFTSQGCSSCPPADALLGEMAARSDVIALTLPVDYWDYLGWRDTLANPVHSNRQRGYAKQRGDHEVYTPQLVVDGLQHCNGADAAAIEKAIADTRQTLAGHYVPIRLAVDRETLTVEIGAAPGGDNDPDGGIVWLALVQKKATVKITRGENRGKDLTYHNVVREMMPVGKWSGEAITLTLPPCRQVRQDIDACTVLLQQGMAGPIIAAAQHIWR